MNRLVLFALFVVTLLLAACSISRGPSDSEILQLLDTTVYGPYHLTNVTITRKSECELTNNQKATSGESERWIVHFSATKNYTLNSQEGEEQFTFRKRDGEWELLHPYATCRW